jgi:hypothetical protein
LHTVQTSTICGETQSNSHDEGAVNFGCHFYSLDFTKGGSWTQEIEVTDGSTATCVLTIGESSETLRIFGTATVPASIYGVKGISNSKVVIAEMDDDDIMKPLSTSKPDFFSETLTADNDTANYEFRFARNDASELPRILVVSLLWHVGNPEFAITNGDEVDDSFVPVYQALCVDDEDGSRCEKWKRTADGSYEAQVNFEYGNEGKLSQTMSIMEMEAWQGANSTLQLMKDSAYIYYNNYRGVKFLNSLEPPRLNPVMIKVYHVGDCSAYFDANAKLRSNFPNFGNLGTFLDEVEATGSAIYYCGSESYLKVLWKAQMPQ